MCKINFFYEDFQYGKNQVENFRNHIRDLVLQFFEVTMNLAPYGVLCIFGNQSITGRVCLAQLLKCQFFCSILC